MSGGFRGLARARTSPPVSGLERLSEGGAAALAPAAFSQFPSLAGRRRRRRRRHKVETSTTATGSPGVTVSWPGVVFCNECGVSWVDATQDCNPSARLTTDSHSNTPTLIERGRGASIRLARGQKRVWGGRGTETRSCHVSSNSAVWRLFKPLRPRPPPRRAPPEPRFMRDAQRDRHAGVHGVSATAAAASRRPRATVYCVV